MRARLLAWSLFCVALLVLVLQHRPLLDTFGPMGSLSGTNTGAHLLLGTHRIRVSKGSGAKVYPHPMRRVLPLGKPYAAATVRFEISFGKDFDFGCKGKVGGFQIGSAPSTGGRHSPWASSFRVMWNSLGGAYMYVYYPAGWGAQASNDKGVEHFLDGFPGAFRKNSDDGNPVWHSVAMRVHLNSFTPVWRNGRKFNQPNPDGRLVLNVDGVEKSVDNVVMRIHPNITLRDFTIDFFHGGPCVATKDMTAWIRDVRMV